MEAGAGVEALVLAAVAATGHPYEVIACDPEQADTAAFCAHYGYPPEESANTIVVASRRPEGRNVACVVLSTTGSTSTGWCGDGSGCARRRSPPPT